MPRRSRTSVESSVALPFLKDAAGNAPHGLRPAHHSVGDDDYDEDALTSDRAMACDQPPQNLDLCSGLPPPSLPDMDAPLPLPPSGSSSASAGALAGWARGRVNMMIAGVMGVKGESEEVMGVMGFMGVMEVDLKDAKPADKSDLDVDRKDCAAAKIQTPVLEKSGDDTKLLKAAPKGMAKGKAQAKAKERRPRRPQSAPQP